MLMAYQRVMSITVLCRYISPKAVRLSRSLSFFTIIYIPFI